jgi:hypothetical protein
MRRLQKKMLFEGRTKRDKKLLPNGLVWLCYLKYYSPTVTHDKIFVHDF